MYFIFFFYVGCIFADEKLNSEPGEGSKQVLILKVLSSALSQGHYGKRRQGSYKLGLQHAGQTCAT